MLVYEVSGFEGKIPFTPAGRGLALSVILLGPVLGALATAWFAALMISHLLEKGMEKNLENHVVILNNNNKLVDLVKELTHSTLQDAGSTPGNGKIAVLASRPNPRLDALINEGGGTSGLGRYGSVWFTQGEPSDVDMLSVVNATKAETIVLLVDKSAGDRADEKNLRILFALRRMANNEKRKNLHVVVEQLDAQNATILQDVGEDFPGLVEPISGSQNAMLMLAQATVTPGLAHFYSELLTVNENSEIYVKKIPEAAIGLTFQRYAAKVILHSEPPASGDKEGNGPRPMIPLGLRRTDTEGNATLVCNPMPGEDTAVLRPGDELILLAHVQPRDNDLPETDLSPSQPTSK